MKTYILFYDGRIGYIKDVCRCNQCVARKQYEWFIYNLNDEFLDCINPKNITKDVLYIGNDLVTAIDNLNNYHKNELSIKCNEVEYLENVCEFYRKETFKGETFKNNLGDSDNIWKDCKYELPKVEGLYYVKSDNTNSMYLCNYKDDKFTLSSYPDHEMAAIKWADYGSFAAEQ